MTECRPVKPDSNTAVGHLVSLLLFSDASWPRLKWSCRFKLSRHNR